MAKHFHTIGIMSRLGKKGTVETLHALISYLQSQQMNCIVEQQVAQSLSLSLSSLPREKLAAYCDLIITVGGDGNLLSAARIAAPNDTPVLGINRGKFGFLTDIPPNNINQLVGEVLTGKFREEKRFMLKVTKKDDKRKENLALNDVIITASDSTHMLDFDVQVNHDFMCRHRSDGIIIATPTGSTAYALSGGGPILHPHLNAIVIVPMFPHTLSLRPIVLSGNSTLTITVPRDNTTSKVSCDGQNYMQVAARAMITIKKAQKPLRLIHPLAYNYFDSLRGKLYWGQKLHHE